MSGQRTQREDRYRTNADVECLASRMYRRAMTRQIACLPLALLLVWPAEACAQADKATPANIPAEQDILGFYPPAAKAAGVEGSASISCQRDEHGALVSCATTSETPAGQGFGAAAVAIATKAPPVKSGTLSADEMARVLPLRFTFKLNPPSIRPDLFHPAVNDPPHWIAAPDAEDMASVFPARAARQGVVGRTVMTCRVNPGGGMEFCSLLSETPSDFGFGAAALKLAPRFKLSRFSAGGYPTNGAYITIPIRWTPPR